MRCFVATCWASSLTTALALSLSGCGTAEAPLAAGAVPTAETAAAGSSEPTSSASGDVDASASSASAPTGSPSPACKGRAPQPEESAWTLAVGGRERVAKVHVPAIVKADVEAPLVLNFHGFTSNASQQALLSGMSAKADKEGFVVVYPEGLQSSWNAGACCGSSMNDSIDDVGFVSALLDEAEKRLCVDKRRIFVTGMSNGAFLLHKLGCTLADRIAAIAPVAGVVATPTCTPSRPVPVFHTHGTLDALVPFFGDAIKGFPSARNSADAWALRNGCSLTPTEVFRNFDARCETYPGCKAGGDVTLCIIEGGGHTWPGGLPVPAFGHTSYSMNVTDKMWEFFRQHPL